MVEGGRPTVTVPRNSLIERLLLSDDRAMAIDVEVTDDPSRVLARAGGFLASDPVRHNVILTLLHARVDNPTKGRYVVVFEAERVVGVVFQSPLRFIATITPMDQHGAEACVDALAARAISLPGISGEAGSAARFAGHWTRAHQVRRHPPPGAAHYEATTITEPSDVPGALRRARDEDRPQIVEWLKGFHEDTAEPLEDPETTVRRRVAAGHFWVWVDEQPASMAALTTPVAGVARVQAVYTPKPLRNRGFASACVARISSMTLASGVRCILYTDLGNPVSNSVYRRIGYHAVTEVLRYEFR